MKILILTNNDVGLYKFRRELLSALLERGHEVLISLPYGPMVDELVSMGCRYERTEFSRRGTNPLKDYGLLRHYRSLLRRERPDVVLTYTSKPNIYGGMAAAALGVPQIANITGLGTAIGSGGALQKLMVALYRVGLRKADTVFCQNQTDYEYVTAHGMGGKACRLLPGSGVNLDAFPYCDYPAASEMCTFVTIGRLVRTKGIDELLTAAERVHRDFPNVRFQLIGEDDQNYLERVEDAAARGVLEYLGPQKDVRPYLRACHCVLHPSYLEGMSNVLLEGAATGRPVIATNVPGCIETYEPGVSGICCKPRDAADLERAIREMIALPHEQKAAMGRAGRAHVESRFDRGIIVAQYLEAIERAAGGGSS